METFVVRIWTPGDGEPALRPLRGFVTEASSGRTESFLDETELIGLVQGALPRAEPNEEEAGDA